MSADYRQRETLVELYHNEGLTMQQMADELECSKSTIHSWMDQHGIERRKRGPDSMTMWTDAKGYERFTVDNCAVYVHRLCALAWYGALPEEVHHLNGVPWDNREQNIEATTKSEHAKLHLQ